MAAINKNNHQVLIEEEKALEQPPSAAASASAEEVEELLIKIPATMVHQIDNRQSVELAYGDLELMLVRENESAVAVLARITDQIQWPLSKDQAVLKLDDSHYLFTFNNDDDDNDNLNYGVTIHSKGQEQLLRRFDEVLEKYTGFKEERVEDEDGDDEENATVYWTRLAPNAAEEEEYSGGIARMIAVGSGMVVKGILWCGDVAVERLKWVQEFLRTRMIIMGNDDDDDQQDAEVSPVIMATIQKVKCMTMKSEELATGLLLGVINLSQRITGSVVNSVAGRCFFSMFPGEIALATSDAYNEIWEAVEAAGKKVMRSTSEVTTDMVRGRYGEEAGRVTNEGMEAIGHGIATVWTFFKIAKALNLKSALKPTSLAKAALTNSKKLA